MTVDLPVWVAAAAAGLAGLQLVLATWRDLGPLTVTALGAALVLVGVPDLDVGLLIGVAAVLAAAGWARGGRRGVGRPGLSGAVAACAVVAWLAAEWLPRRLPLDPAGTRQVAAVALAVVGLVCAMVALERKRGGGPGVRWVGEIPIR